MGLSFFEVMQGELTSRDGTRSPIDFEIKAETGTLSAWRRTGRLRVVGVLRAPPWTEAAAVTGEMCLGLVGDQIRYTLCFHDDDGREVELRGKKRARWSRPVSWLTHLDATLIAGDELLATGILRFDLRKLRPFLRSFRWTPGPARSNEHDVSSGLSGGADETLRALGETLISKGKFVPVFDERSQKELALRLREVPPRFFRSYEAGLGALNALARVRYGRAFHMLSLERRQRLLNADSTQERAGVRVSQRLLQVLALPVRAAHFTHPSYLSGIGHPERPPVAPEARPRFMERVTEAEDLDPDSEIRAEVVVVGTGAGGAVVAAELARRGLAVVLLEEGRFYRREHFGANSMDRVSKIWRLGGAHFALGAPLVIPLGRAVGGTTTINSGTCFATPPSVLESWRSELGFPSDFAPEKFADLCQRILSRLEVAPSDPHVLGRVVDVIRRGADTLGVEHGALPRNAPGCTGAGECIFGCPEGAKRSTDTSFVPSALLAGAHMYTGLPVTQILMRGSRALGVESRGTDRHGRVKTLRVLADRVVLACGAIHTPALLLESGFRSPWLGRNLSVHPGMGVVARCAEDLAPWMTVPQGYGVHFPNAEGILFEGYYLPPPLLAMSFPWNGAELTRWMDDFARLAQFGFMVRDEGAGRVFRGPGGPMVTYRLSKLSKQRLQLGASLTAELLLQGGAKEVFVGIGPHPVVSSIGEARALREASVPTWQFNLLGAHPLGTCRMAASKERGVVDFDYRVFGTENLLVVDGSIVPTSLGVNPQVTIMAMALRAAEILARSHAPSTADD